MPVGMILIAGNSRKINAVECKTTGYNIHDAFECIGKYSVRLRKKISRELQKHQEDARKKR